MSRAFAFIAACSFVLGWSACVLADPDASTEQARQWYAQGKAQYEAKDYVSAAANFERSYALVQSSALLFDIAQAHRLAGRGHCAASRRYYHSYLELEPRAENQREVAERLAEIDACAEAEEQASATPLPGKAPDSSAVAAAPTASSSRTPQVPTTPEKPALPHGSTPTVAVLTTGVGAALLVTGAVLYLRARQRFDEAKRSCPCPNGSFSDWQKLSDLSYGLMAVGGAGVVAGGTYWAISVRRDGAHGSSAFVGVDGRF